MLFSYKLTPEDVLIVEQKGRGLTVCNPREMRVNGL